MSDHLLLKTPFLPLHRSSLSYFTEFRPPCLVSPRVSIRCYGAALRKDLCTPAAAMDGLEAAISVELERITGEDQFDLVMKDTQRIKEPVVVLWMANWCRKCIYLKPKLEKLAAEFYPRVRFYCIDVNLVPQRLVNRAGITKMPTIQLWNDCKIQGEVNGGYASWMVIEDIRRMIENEEP
ncbi:hypothetical protein LUZ60_006889 [Juncus effusus]|nr:hypothetical protein LUZ60_006889 [Juncus effusus]